MSPACPGAQAPLGYKASYVLRAKCLSPRGVFGWAVEVLLRGKRPVLGEHFPSVQVLCQGQLLMRARPCRAHLSLPGATPVWPGHLGSGRAPIQQGWGHNGPWWRQVLALPEIGLKGPFGLPLLSNPAGSIFWQPLNQAGLVPEKGAAQCGG